MAENSSLADFMQALWEAGHTLLGLAGLATGQWRLEADGDLYGTALDASLSYHREWCRLRDLAKSVVSNVEPPVGQTATQWIMNLLGFADEGLEISNLLQWWSIQNAGLHSQLPSPDDVDASGATFAKTVARYNRVQPALMDAWAYLNRVCCVTGKESALPSSAKPKHPEGNGRAGSTPGQPTIVSAKSPTSWKPSKATLHVIKLMKQGLSNNTIVDRADVKVKRTAVNIRRIRCRGKAAGLLKSSEDEKRDTA